jgi:hypothetical protein
MEFCTVVNLYEIIDAYPIEHMQLAWNKTKQPLVVINTQMAEFEIADISCTSENVTYKAGRSSNQIFRKLIALHPSKLIN